MQPTSGTTESIWMATADPPSEGALATDARANVCIIGAGIAGLTTAYLLGPEGKTVTVLDDGPMVTPGEVDSAAEIAKGEGEIMRRGLSKVAVYRDQDGTVHSMSAVCVHLGCIVTWNPAEKIWDCPCHGSRYDRFGRVISGPANSDLPPVDLT